ncbi:hypothetical protein P5618_029460 (plasmid) [Priestia megaterium]|uniref:hypothetical protein n=1 Tax=Bacillaceae TaxID=186817 RepID=UPI002453068D|nr:hypothetical protein [Priestia megaterium]MDH3177886.1 hypothetical protein [Priestia megaterium]
MKVSVTKLSTTILFAVLIVSFMLYITIQNNIHTRENTIKEYLSNLSATTDLENKNIAHILNTNKKNTFFLLLKTNTSDKNNILVPIGLKKDLLGWKSFDPDPYAKADLSQYKINQKFFNLPNKK